MDVLGDEWFGKMLNRREHDEDHAKQGLALPLKVRQGGNERRERDAIILIVISAHCRSNCVGHASLAEPDFE